MTGDQSNIDSLSKVSVATGILTVAVAFVFPFVAVVLRVGSLSLIYLLPPIALLGVIVGALSIKSKAGKIGLVLNVLGAILGTSLAYAITNPRL